MFRTLRMFYEDLYSALYSWSLQRWHGDDYMASFLTACTLAGAVYMNVLLSMAVIVVFYGPDTLNAVFPPIASNAILAFVLLAHYFGFVHDRRYERIAQRFASRPAPTRRRISLVAWTYVVTAYFSMLIFTAGAAILME